MKLTGSEIVIECLKEQGVDALYSGVMQELINEDKRKRYRNPPAHTRYLPYYLAKECRDYVRNAIIKLGDWFCDQRT